ncbi:2-oxo acid dehydrogenase subunit E2 [Nocardia sp. NEAU-G5]|uniref:Dihydrolipoamide acetyltransferase component of pyruvate dehydrogenase complex n=1 Tax=Nocardia albiluteola TaxID=2842303 RepID=A0ABS6AUN9_9NOCA|nr:dihydrolipoamide acetyltransferase family protein [Nocardia albiluteola]MBU3061734.1 2-oxo acid dehydrogenase subunit E2 [Nocardia albiluteola]
MDDAARELEFRLPDLGEGLTEAELISWAVAVGDVVELNQTIAEVETAKAQVALPCPFAGRVTELLAQPGDTVPVGAPLIRVHSDTPAASAGANGTAERQASGETAAPSERRSVLVGYGPDDESTSRRTRRSANFDAAQANSLNDEESGEEEAPVAYPDRPAATPGARKLARELGISLTFVAGSGPGGAVTVEDVRHAVPVSQPGNRIREDDPAAAAPRPSAPRVPAMRPDGGVIRPTPTTTETRTPVSGVRKRTAAAMLASARTIPQASTFVTTDFTASMELLDHLRGTDSFTGLTLTPLALVAKATVAAMAEFPGLNSFWDEEAKQIVTKHYVNLGIAVATDRGLLVPNIKDAHTLSLRELCREIGWLADIARAGSATPADLRGGTFTITNVGVFGVDTGVPLVNPGEAAILCLGSIRKRPWVYRDELAVRWVTTVGLSFDHRMIDGELGARFLATVASLLEDPLTLLGRI